MDSSLEQRVRRRAKYVCEYCRAPESRSKLPYVLDHIIARQHGGKTTIENLALSCGLCNRHKGPNIAGLDVRTGSLTALFNPRHDKWTEHFGWRNEWLVGLTAKGQATIRVLAMNERRQLAIRRALIDERVFPPRG